MTAGGASREGSQQDPQAASLVEVLRFRAAHQPDRLAYHFLTDGGSEGTSLTYSALDLRAREIAEQLSKQLGAGERALLLYPPGRDFLEAFLGCLYAGVVAIPLYPPRPSRSLARWQAVTEDSGARAALTQAGRIESLANRWAEEPGLAALKCLATDEVAGSEPSFRPHVPAAGDLAYLQYTSGSTSTPKGVMVTHGNLVFNCDYMRKVYGLSPETMGVTWVPHFHDLGLIDGLLSPLFTGFPTAVLSAGQFAQRPLLWLETITRFRATHSGGPNFAYELCVQKVKPEQRGSLDLSSWSLAFSGAEPVRKETLDAFSEYFEPCGFRREAFMPAYGLAEATLMVTGGTKGAGPRLTELDGPELEQGRAVPASKDSRQTRWLVGCGRVREEVDVKIVDPAGGVPLPEREVGEIWASGPTIAAGYWRREQETERTFRARLPDGSGPYLRTGDLGYLEHGELYVAARLKDLIIVRGGNVYPQDVEWAAQRSNQMLRRGYGAAFGVEVAGEERLVLVQEVDRQLRKSGAEELEEIARGIRQVIAAEFDLETYCIQLVMPGQVPITSSGKIQRQAAREGFLAGGSEPIYESRLPLAQTPASGSKGGPVLRPADLAAMRPSDRRRRLIKHVRDQVAEVLGITPGYVLPDKPLGSFGLDSLKGNELTAALSQDFGIELSSTLVWNYPTVAEIAAHVAQRLEQLAQSDGKLGLGESEERLRAG